MPNNNWPPKEWGNLELMEFAFGQAKKSLDAAYDAQRLLDHLSKAGNVPVSFLSDEKDLKRK